MALVAVWLTALVPTVSRTVDWLAFPDLGAWCEAMPASHHGMSHGDMDDMDHDTMPHAAMGHATGGHDACDPDAACGYCTLFAQLPAVAGAVFVGHPLLAVLHVPAPLPSIRAGPTVALVHAPPRGPPAVAHA
ncbi:Protein of unknown function [Luteibacter sp. UNCMF331Sha3.1]|uniref:DUF2946 family protein n=1 Tax=Luteibacter sp. UNCMF331Sha3.1 TaxID=1502760 RepID=UPI0008BEA508|nr:DUF2946 family protein [Luteibacter sp. UNCMF331Sha3.1]SEM51266.1 Protein of unknown function [Luteibacter sp. UNCMF331Sha3.1]